MADYLFGFIERRFESEDSKKEWEFFMRTGPVVGTQSVFRDVFYGNDQTEYFDDIPRNNGFPDDIAAGTCTVMYSDIKLQHLDKENIRISKNDLRNPKFWDNLDETYGDYRWLIDPNFYQSYQDDSNSAFWISYDQLKKIDQDQNVRGEVIDEIRSDLEDEGYGHDPGELQKVFKLLIDGKEKSRLWITHNDEIELSGEDVRTLLTGKKLSKNGKILELEVRNMKEMLGEEWTKLWDLLQTITENELQNIRIIFCYAA